MRPTTHLSAWKTIESIGYRTDAAQERIANRWARRTTGTHFAQTKLWPELVSCIREQHRRGRTITELCALYPMVCRGTLQSVINRWSWRHVR